MAVTIRPATTAEDYRAFAGLCQTYVEWCRARYAHDAWFVSEVFGYQSIDDEMKDLSLKYGPPKGRTLLAVTDDDEVVAAGAYWRTSEAVCEMKRLYVVRDFAGQGVGRQLATALFEAARDDGYRLMQLDTGKLLTEAIAMYKSLGFQEIAPYNTYPDKLMPYLVFMERAL